jgi:hypothetical protein
VPPVLRLSAGLLALPAVLPGAAAVRQVTVAATPVERAAMVVTLLLPRDLADGAILRDSAGRIVPLQAEADLSARFIIARQAANQALRFTLEPGRAPELGNVQVVEEPSPPRPGNTPGIAASAGASMIQARTGRLRVSVGGRPVLYYQMDKDAVPREDIDPKWRRAGYLHPVLTPRGITVTEEVFPRMRPDEVLRPGITTLGPWSGRDDRQQFDAALEFGEVANTWAGPVHGGFTSWQRWVSPDTVLVNESWEFTAYAVPRSLGEINVFDLAIVQANATASAVHFIEEGLSVRGTRTWGSFPAEWPKPIFEDATAQNHLLRWVGLAGSDQDHPAGIAVLFPSTETSKYRANPIEPSVTAPGDSLVLAPNARQTLRHRFVVFDGPPDNALLEALWNGYTVPAVVTISGP